MSTNLTNIRKPALHRPDIVEPELSYKIMGVLFDVSNTLGSGYSEVYYQRAFANALQDAGVKFKREVLLPIKFHSRVIGKQRCDFIVEGRVLIEMKKNKAFSRSNIQQVFDYLRATNLRLAILVNFTPQGIMFKRIVNDNSYVRKNS